MLKRRGPTLSRGSSKRSQMIPQVTDSDTATVQVPHVFDEGPNVDYYAELRDSLQEINASPYFKDFQKADALDLTAEKLTSSGLST